MGKEVTFFQVGLSEASELKALSIRQRHNSSVIVGFAIFLRSLKGKMPDCRSNT
jgi:hypothetical protein